MKMNPLRTKRQNQAPNSKRFLRGTKTENKHMHASDTETETEKFHICVDDKSRKTHILTWHLR